jgi:DNA-binding transcriptional LysR family regulator
MADRDAVWGMEVFLKILETGSIAAAARALRVTPSAVSKQLAKLEARLGVRLLRRTTRRLSPTGEGLRYAEHAGAILGAIEAAEREIAREEDTPRGKLRVSAPTLLGQEIIAPLAARFLAENPRVELELDLSDGYVDLVKESFDLAVRIAPRLRENGLIARKIGVNELILVASPRYLEGAPPLRRPRDLSQHRCLELAHSSDRGRWSLAASGRTFAVPVRDPVVCSNSLVALHRLALAGAGVASLPTYLVRRDIEERRLAQVLPSARRAQRSIYVVHAGGRLVTTRVRRFADLLARDLPGEIRLRG